MKASHDKKRSSFFAADVKKGGTKSAALNAAKKRTRVGNDMKNK